MHQVRLRRHAVVLAAIVSLAGAPRHAGGQAALQPQLVNFQTGSLALAGWLWRPQGSGPFPAVLYNHGSEKLPGTVESLAVPFVQRGYVFFVPHRRGQGSTLLVRLHEEQLNDQLAALTFLRTQPFVDGARIAAYGFSFGGIQTMLAVENPSFAYRAAVNCSGAAQSWEGSPDLRARLTKAAQGAGAPVYFLQAANDYSLEPNRALAAAMTAAGKSFTEKVYPAFGSSNQDGHEFCLRGIDAFGVDVFSFLDSALK
jgi:carboxymethylenebutenolidase